jgi:hypothetical protein
MAIPSALFPRRLESKLKSKKLLRVRRQEEVMKASIGPRSKFQEEKSIC